MTTPAGLPHGPRPVVVVTNNATDAVETYLYRYRIDALVSGIVGRSHGRPELMKPDTEPITRALRILDAKTGSSKSSSPSAASA
jgi:hypothetical protein